MVFSRDEEFKSVSPDDDIQCKTCAISSDGTPWTNDYRKSNCQAYPRPLCKPLEILFEHAGCKHYKQRVDS
jgi:hypothetical protein